MCEIWHTCILLFYGYSKDVRLPANLQRAMAAEAEASREAKAKVGEILEGQIHVKLLTVIQYCGDTVIGR